jgi:hypothetical protein
MKLELTPEIVKLNCIWMRKIKKLYVVLVFLFFASYVDTWSFLNDFFEGVARFVPMIKGLLLSDVYEWRHAARYFSLVAVILPVFVLWVVWEDDVVARCRYREGHEKVAWVKNLALVYFVGLPILISIVYLVICAPFGYAEKPGNFGQTIFYLLLHSEAGLLFVGSFFAVCFAQLLVFLSWLICFPFACLFKSN